jgi:RNA polymerase sigma-70 factor (ECF subfamily)
MAARSPESLNELLNRAREGAPADRDRLFDACRSYLIVLARAQVDARMQGKVDASDIVQQTMLEAHRDFARFQGGSGQEWLAWLRRILTHNAADQVRRFRGTAKRQAGREVAIASPQDSQPVGVGEPADPGASPSECVMLADETSRLAEALTTLPPDYQTVIALRNLERLPFDEVARRMDRSRPAAQMLWMRALKKLSEQMGTSELLKVDAP